MRFDQSRGFTLVEMSAVIVVIGIVAAITVMGTSNLVRSNRLVGATNTLVADLRYARTLAATERRDIDVRFTSGGYSLVRVSSSDTLLRRSCPPGVTCSASNPATFYAWGLTAPSTITMTVSGHSNVLNLAENGNVSHSSY